MRIFQNMNADDDRQVVTISKYARFPEEIDLERPANRISSKNRIGSANSVGHISEKGSRNGEDLVLTKSEFEKTLLEMGKKKNKKTIHYKKLSSDKIFIITHVKRFWEAESRIRFECD